MGVNVNVEVLFSDDVEKRYVCFMHAVQLAMAGKDIAIEAEGRASAEDDEYDMRDKSCYKCDEE